MLRIIAVAVFAVLVTALFLVPGVSPAQLGTSQVADLVRADAECFDPEGNPLVDAAGAPVTKPLWEILLESDSIAEEVDADGNTVRFLRPGGVQYVPEEDVYRDGERPDPIWHQQTIKGVIRELRSIVGEEKRQIRIDAYKKPDPSGFNLDARVSPTEITLLANQGGVPIGRVKQQWQPITQRSLLPPLIAIFLAILFRRPVLALFAGVWAGAFLVLKAKGTASFGAAAVGSFADVFRKYFLDQLGKQARQEIVLFVIFMLAMVGVITRAGGIRGIMDLIAGLARDARKTQMATWFMGLCIFFDDYANTILVGSTMRPLADKFRVAREKLAYIVDSTAAPVAGVSILSTWIAFEVSTFSAQLPDAGLPASAGYSVFLQTLPYRFYCWFTLIFVGMVVFSGRDFGPMLKAERRARSGKVLRDGAKPLVSDAATALEPDTAVVPRASTAIVPLLGFVLTTLGMIIYKGSIGIGLLKRDDGFPFVKAGESKGSLLETMTGILFEGSGEEPLMIGAIAGFVLAAIFALFRGLGVDKILKASFHSLLAMGTALVILYLAWMVGQVCEDLGTASYLSATLGTTTPYLVLPIVLFLLAGLIAFSTGSSWSTMTILLPLVVGLSYSIGYDGSAELADEGKRAFGLLLMTISIGAVLEGAIFGDHCSPISDTTVMSSIACASDHVDHVRTQAPYAILTMAVALVFGYFPVVVGVSPWISLVLGTVVLALVLFLRGKRTPETPPEGELNAPEKAPA